MNNKKLMDTYAEMEEARVDYGRKSEKLQKELEGGSGSFDKKLFDDLTKASERLEKANGEHLQEWRKHLETTPK